MNAQSIEDQGVDPDPSGSVYPEDLQDRDLRALYDHDRLIGGDGIGAVIDSIRQDYILKVDVQGELDAMRITNTAFQQENERLHAQIEVLRATVAMHRDKARAHDAMLFIIEKGLSE